MIDGLGWAATALFVGSYFCANPLALKRVQMIGALVWVAYGILLGASPVIVANVLVFAAAATTALGGRTADRFSGDRTVARHVSRQGDPERP